MKFHLSTAEGNVFTGHGPDYVRLGVVEYRDNVLVTPERVATGWTAGGFDTLTEAVLDDRHVTETAFVHHQQGVAEGLFRSDRLRLRRHHVRQPGRLGIATLGEHAKHRVALGEDAGETAVILDYHHRADAFFLHQA